MSPGRPPEPPEPALADAASTRFEVFFDGGCPLCRREIAFLRKRDRHRRLRFSDLGAPGFDAEATTGRSAAELMNRIHGRMRSGAIVEGVEVFRNLYAAIGFTRLVAWSRLPVLSRILDWMYGVFARNRLWLTGRRAALGGCTPVSCAREPAPGPEPG
jgi:predicted DCC family thiol-disulfide oxidoreductase YuxK